MPFGQPPADERARLTVVWALRSQKLYCKMISQALAGLAANLVSLPPSKSQHSQDTAGLQGMTTNLAFNFFGWKEEVSKLVAAAQQPSCTPKGLLRHGSAESVRTRWQG